MDFWLGKKMKVFFSAFCMLIIGSANAQYLVDYLAEAEKNFVPTSHENIPVNDFKSTDLSFGYFINPQETISGSQRAYVQLQQQIPWLGKGLAYRKLQKYNQQLNSSTAKSQLAQLKFEVKQSYYSMYSFFQQKDVHLVYASKLRKFVENFKIDSVSADGLLKKLKYEQELIEVTKKLQLVDGEFQKEELRFKQLLKTEDISEVNLPLELAMPDEEGSISFSETYENPLFLNFENSLLALKHAQSFNNKWFPSVSLGFRFIEVGDALNLIVDQLPNQNIYEPQLRLQWNLFSRNSTKISNTDIEDKIEQKAISISNDLQILINDQISARIAYFSSLEKLDQLQEMKDQLLQKNVSLSAEQQIELDKLKAFYELEKIEAVTSYYVCSSKMLLYQ